MGYARSNHRDRLLSRLRRRRFTPHRHRTRWDGDMPNHRHCEHRANDHPHGNARFDRDGPVLDALLDDDERDGRLDRQWDRCEAPERLRQRRPQMTTTYTLTASGAGGTATKQVTVTVQPPPAIPFSASPTSIAPGQSSTVTWTTTNATTVTTDGEIAGQALT